ncbi:MAG TPA: enamine deaminase RidA [Chloroflexi bacterium]|nr:enamine deaminase RidA [Chloroflexota bacterium]HAL25309.1 enamine deaminase RidA [Chloroflexota bacterium]
MAIVPATDRLIYVSGQVAIDESGTLVGKGDAAKQAEQVFKNIHRILTDSGATIGDIVKLNWYFRNMGDRAGIVAARDRFLGTHRPASTAVEVSRLVNEDWLIEVDCVAAIRG